MPTFRSKWAETALWVEMSLPRNARRQGEKWEGREEPMDGKKEPAAVENRCQTLFKGQGPLI